MISKITWAQVVSGAVFGAVWSFVQPIDKFIWVTICIVLADLITGIIAALNRGDKISSYGVKRTVVKFTLYIIAILASRALMVAFAPEGMEHMMHFTWVVAGTICLTEITSIFENVEQVTGVPLISRLDYFKKMLNKDKPE